MIQDHDQLARALAEELRFNGHDIDALEILDACGAIAGMLVKLEQPGDREMAWVAGEEGVRE